MLGSDVFEVGRIGKPKGLQGWNRVQCDIDPALMIASQAKLLLKGNAEALWTAHQIVSVEGAPNTGRIAIRCLGANSREAAECLVGLKLGLKKSHLPVLPLGEYYWNDFIGLQVFSVEGRHLGHVQGLLETGANDVLVVLTQSGKEQLIPCLFETVIQEVCLANRRLVVDWPWID